MATSKVTMILHGTTIDSDGNAFRAGGQSETVYTDLEFGSSQLETAITDLCRKRAKLLPINCQIVAQWVQQVSPVGGSRLYEDFFKGAAGEQNDIPQTALSFHLRSLNGLSHREYALGMVPDNRVQKGEYVGTINYNRDLLAYFTELKLFWKMKCRNKALPAHQLESMTVDGAFVTKTAHGFAVGNYVRCLNVADRFGIGTSGVFRVGTVVGAFGGTLIGFESRSGNAIKFGKLRLDGEVFQGFEFRDSEIRNPTATTKPVGEPFFSFRGRQSARRG